MRISEITAATSGQLIGGDTEAVIRGISIDTRTLQPEEHTAGQRIPGDGEDYDLP